MRLFAAVRPPPDILVHLEAALASVCDVDPVGGARSTLRWTPARDRHVTLAFYGEVPEGYLDDLAEALDAVAGDRPPFDAALRGAGLFDGRALWVGCAGDGWGPLMAAAGQVGEDLLGRSADGRSRPHLTVARVGGRARAGRVPGGPRPGPTRPGRDDRRYRSGDDAGPGKDGAASGRTVPGGPARPSVLAHALALYTGPTWTVGEIALMSSRLGDGPGGTARYAVVHRSVLSAVAG